MIKFLRNLLATVVGLFIFFGITFFILIGIGAAVATSQNKEVNIKEKSVLIIDLDEEIIEYREPNPLDDFDLEFIEKKIGLNEINQAIENATIDDKIKGIYLNVSSIKAGYAKTQEIRNKLKLFKETGKFIIAYSEVYTEKAYYLTSVANEIYILPTGDIELNGLASNITYFKGLFRKFDIEPEIFKVGEFKSAIEPFIRENMSEANRLQTEAYLNSLNNIQLKNISSERNIDFNNLVHISSEFKINNVNDAEKYKLINLAIYEDEVEKILNLKLRQNKNEKINKVSIKQYNKSKIALSQYSENEIAVIVAEGEIKSGKSSENTIGSASIAKQLKKARLNDKIKAIVLRINSPGGSAMASDVMWREVEKCKAVKPIIASMSDVAASGGYYMAMGCNKIVAQPNTITGSIGVFGMFFNIGDFMKNKIGITTDGVKTGKYSDFMNNTRGISDFERNIIQKQVEKTYETFTTKAAEGRNMDIEEIKKVASGRVWTGEQAKENGLVDELGGLDYAIKLAASEANLNNGYSIEYYPKFEDELFSIFPGLQSKIKSIIGLSQFSEIELLKKQVENLESYKGIQTNSFINANYIE